VDGVGCNLRSIGQLAKKGSDPFLCLSKSMSLEELISGPHLWRGRAGSTAQPAVSTGFEALDRVLPGGGWPWGAVIEVFAERYGVGELRLWMPALAASSRSGPQTDWIAFVAPPLIPYAPALTRYGIGLDRVLLVETAEMRGETLWAAEQAVRSGACAAVLAWLRSSDETALRRLQLAAEARSCGLMLFRPMAALARRSPAALRLRVSGLGPRTRVEIIKCRGGRPACIDLDLPDLGLVPAAAETAPTRTGETRCG
jgi:protein ImuA